MILPRDKNDLEKVAKLVGAEPWLPEALESFIPFIGSSKPTMSPHEFHDKIEKMYQAARTLEKYLPAYKHWPLFDCPKEIAMVLAGLPGTIKHLELARRTRKGRRPDARRKLCAAVIVHAWKLVHGEAPLRSEKLTKACQEYWRACGGEPRGAEDDFENWRRDIDRAHENAWISKVLVAYRDGT